MESKEVKFHHKFLRKMNICYIYLFNSTPQCIINQVINMRKFTLTKPLERVDMSEFDSPRHSKVSSLYILHLMNKYNGFLSTQVKNE